MELADAYVLFGQLKIKTRLFTHRYLKITAMINKIIFPFATIQKCCIKHNYFLLVSDF